MNIITACAQEDDIPDIMALEAKGFLAGILEEEEVFLERIKVFSDGFLILKDQETNALIGYISSEIWQVKEPYTNEKFSLNHRITDLHDVMGDELYISSMTIDPAYRGQGMGKILFHTCVARQMHIYPHLKSLILLVNETWHQARQIYSDYGLVEIGRLPGFFSPTHGDFQDGLVMRKAI